MKLLSRIYNYFTKKKSKNKNNNKKNTKTKKIPKKIKRKKKNKKLQYYIINNKSTNKLIKKIK